MFCSLRLVKVICLQFPYHFRSLRCTRIRIHTQLFTSLALSCISWMLWYKFVVEAPSVVIENPVWCIGLHLLTQYLTICNYFWMFCEGVHLHLVLVVVFVKDNIAMRIFLVIGWMLPTAVINLYGFLRWKNYDDNKLLVKIIFIPPNQF